MVSIYRLWLSVILLGSTCLVPAKAQDTARIGIPQSIFRDVPPALLEYASQPFQHLIKMQTGMTGEIHNEKEWQVIAKQIDEGKMDLGVFLGHEFAWAKEKYPNLEPLVIAVPKPREVQAFIVVRWDCKAKTLGDLKGQKMSIPKNTRDHSRLFLERKQREVELRSNSCEMVKCDTIHEALQQIIDGDLDVTVADHASYVSFQKLWPGPSENLKILIKSEVFPSTVVAYKKGALPPAVQAKFRDGMMTAHKTKQGEFLMRTLKLQGFEEVPATYEQDRKSTLKIYPPTLASAPTPEK